MGRKSKYFRYLEKYVGTYSVRAEVCQDTGDFPRDEDGKIIDSFEDLYIDCEKGKIKHTYEEGILAWYLLEKPITGRGVIKKLEENKIWFKDDSTEEDTLIYFKEEDLEKVDKFIRPRTKGKRTPPFKALNSSAEYVIPAEDNQKLNDITSSLSGMDKMLFIGKTTRDFDAIIQKKKGSRYDISKQRKEASLRPKQFIHYLGMWDEYLDFVQGEMNKR